MTTPQEKAAEARAEPAATPPRPRESVETVVEGPPATSEEVGGPRGPEPTRFGDWERKGRCVDF